MVSIAMVNTRICLNILIVIFLAGFKERITFFKLLIINQLMAFQ